MMDDKNVCWKPTFWKERFAGGFGEKQFCGTEHEGKEEKRSKKKKQEKN